MKAILEFNLPEERGEFELINKASQLYSVLFDFDQWVRHKMKYESIEKIELIEVREKLYELMSESGVNFD